MLNGLWAFLCKPNVGSVPDWIGAVGTIGAVYFAVKSRVDKPKIKIFATYVHNVSKFYKRIGQEDNGDPKYSDDVDHEESGYILDIYISNTSQPSGLVTEWGVVRRNGEKLKLSGGPLIVEGLSSVHLKYAREDGRNSKDTYIIQQVNKSLSDEMVRLYFKDSFDKIHYQKVKMRNTED